MEEQLILFFKHINKKKSIKMFPSGNLNEILSLDSLPS
jgi:hypothetical protein